MNKFKILISGAGTATCIGVIKGLRKEDGGRDVEIHTMDINEYSAGRILGDRFHKIPLAASGNFVEKLLEIVCREKIQLLIPIVDYEFEKLSQNKATFAEYGCHVAISNFKTVNACNDKLLTYEFFRKINIPSPITAHFTKREAEKFGYSFILKPVDGRASHDVYKIENRDDLEYYSTKTPNNMIMQQFVEGDEITVDFLSNFDGKLVGFVPRYRIEVKSGISYKGKTFRDEKLERYIRKIVKSLNYAGPGNVQCMKVVNDYVFIEINPRFSGALPLSIEAGMNSPRLLLDLCRQGFTDYRCGSYRENVFMMRYWEETFCNEDNF